MNRHPSLQRRWIPLLLMVSVAGPVVAAEFCVAGEDDTARTHATLDDALVAASLSATADTIRVVQGAADAGQALWIDDRDLTLAGGYATCSEDEPVAGARTVISGAGGAPLPVMFIVGPGTVRLVDLDIREGDSDYDGGGILYAGSERDSDVNTLILTRTRAQDNVAAHHGGGIAFFAGSAQGSDQAQLVLEAGSEVNRNRAEVNGGGLYLHGRARLVAEAHALSFHGNEAGWDGGAIHLQHPAQADIGSGRFDGIATFYRNRSGNDGGAIHVEAPGDEPLTSLLRLYSIVPDQPLSFEQNSAASMGGAISVDGEFGRVQLSRSVMLCARNINLIGNRATEGAALALAHASYETCEWMPDFPEAAVVDCTPLIACNRIEGNRSAETEEGSIVELKVANGTFERHRIVANRTGSHLFRIAGESSVGSDLWLNDSLVADNLFVAPSARMFGLAGFASVFGLDHTTIAGNDFGAADRSATVIDDPGGILLMQLSNSIIHQPGARLERTGPVVLREIAHLLLHEALEDQDHNPTVLVAEPRFDPAGDFRLLPDSPAVDFAPDGGPRTDLEGALRDVDLAGVDNLFGPVDLGAYELQATPLEPLLVDGFETPVPDAPDPRGSDR